MRLPSRDRGWLVALQLVLGCATDEGHPAPVLGARCAGREAACDGDDAIIDCIVGTWTRVPCTELCAPDAAAGCMAHGDVASCNCEDATSSDGGPAPFACMGTDTLLVCDDGTCTPFDCAELCADDPLHPESLGCMDDACRCTAVGTACADDERPRCDGVFALLSCDAGVWIATDCHDHPCEDDEIGVCVVTTEGVDACGCYR